MKKSVRFLLCLLMTVSVISCQKEISQESGQGGPVTGVLKMKIDGQQWVASKAADATILAGYIVIQGLSSDDRALIIQLEDNGIGTYQLDQNATGVAGVTDPQDANGITYTTNQGAGIDDAGGTVVITKIDQTNKTISGTFSFKVYREMDNKQLTITEGVFENLKYSTELPPNAGADAEFKVKIDGTLWTGQVVSGAAASGQLIISATETNVSKSVGLFLPADITPGTYDFTQLGAYIGIYTYGTGNPPTTLTSESGKITITEHNTSTKTIKGTFYFTAKEFPNGTATAQFTEGSFSVKYL